MTSRNSTDSLNNNTILIAKMYIIPDILPPGTYAETDSLVNNSSFEIRWFVEDWYKTNEIMGNDTKYFIIEYMTDSGTEGQDWGEWIFWGNFSAEEESAIFTGATNSLILSSGTLYSVLNALINSTSLA